MTMQAAQETPASDMDGGSDSPLARLTGRPLPAIALPSTSGVHVQLVELSRAVLYFYPSHVYSPESGYDSPPLDDAQHRAFARHWSDFLALNCLALGVSSQSDGEQSIVTSGLG